MLNNSDKVVQAKVSINTRYLQWWLVPTIYLQYLQLWYSQLIPMPCINLWYLLHANHYISICMCAFLGHWHCWCTVYYVYSFIAPSKKLMSTTHHIFCLIQTHHIFRYYFANAKTVKYTLSLNTIYFYAMVLIIYFADHWFSSVVYFALLPSAVLGNANRAWHQFFTNCSACLVE